MRSPACTPRLTFESNGLTPYDFDTFSRLTRLMGLAGLVMASTNYSGTGGRRHFPAPVEESRPPQREERGSTHQPDNHQ
ncbi:Uncharacterised protein [Mycobacteroides abscessus subsp. abscessus]|nr:Uncharacterised protein [Mycobacteroides abscessus]SHS28151.1 Uncharacterised protein [Mycobacteroides abscessus subsp. abscessus]CQA11517.1 Uncharacterised protein [Mycobacteroides abscessus]SHW18677.1 Uncharacterised protein [Mycobacteroides abscessus subsp. abscessus]SHX35774.1 Uncharacterised protein [Mycobacteroides abscessus subsp. abscessus]